MTWVLIIFLAVGVWATATVWAGERAARVEELAMIAAAAAAARTAAAKTDAAPPTKPGFRPH